MIDLMHDIAPCNQIMTVFDQTLTQYRHIWQIRPTGGMNSAAESRTEGRVTHRNAIRALRRSARAIRSGARVMRHAVQ